MDDGIVDRASELLWQAGHPAIGDGIEKEVARLEKELSDCRRHNAKLRAAIQAVPGHAVVPEAREALELKAVK